MPKDRTWVLLDDRRLEAFQNGCGEFLDFAFPKCAIDNKIRCPCRDCKCRKFGDRDFVHKHLLWRGWDKFYGNGRWTLHLESEEEYVGGQMNDVDVVKIPEVVVVNESDDVSVDVDDNIDALEEHGSTIGQDGTEQPYIDTTPEQLVISADLERVFEESMFEGNEESTANTLAIEKVLGKRKGLGITSSNSSSRRGGTSRLSSSRQEEMEAEMKLLREQMQDKDDKMEKLQEQMREQAQSFNALLESLRQQGIQAPPPTTSNNGGM